MSKDFAVGPQGPALDEPIIINDDGSVEAIETALKEVIAEEPIVPDLPQIDVTLALTEKEFNAITRAFATFMMMIFPQLFFSSDISAEGIETFVAFSEHVGLSQVSKLTEEEARACKNKLALISLDILKRKGLNVKEILHKQMKMMAEMGFDTKVSESIPGEYHGEVVESTEQARPADGDTPTQEAQRGSEPEPGQS